MEDIILFNKHGGLGIGVPPVKDCLTLDIAGSYYSGLVIHVYDTNGNLIDHSIPLRTYSRGNIEPDVMEQIEQHTFNKQSFVEPSEYTKLQVPQGEYLYMFIVDINSTVAPDVFAIVPIDKVANIDFNSQTDSQNTGNFLVHVDNTNNDSITLYHKGCILYRRTL